MAVKEVRTVGKGRGYSEALGGLAFKAVSPVKYFYAAGAVVALGFLTYFYFWGPEVIQNSYYNIYVLVALVVGFAYNFLVKSRGLSNSITAGVIIALLVGTIILFSPTILEKVYEKTPIFGAEIKKLGDTVLKRVDPTTYIAELGIVGGTFEKPKAEDTAKQVINNKFNLQSKDPVRAFATLGVLAKEEDLNLRVKCMLDGEEIDIDNSELVFRKMENEQFASVECSSDRKGNELSLIVEAPFQTETVLDVYVGEGTRGRIKSKQLHEAPYALALDLFDNQPLAERDLPYPFQVKLFRIEKGTKLKEVNSLIINSLSQRYDIECSFPFEKLSFSASEKELERAIIDKAKDALVFNCNLEVRNVPESGDQLSIVGGVAKYTIEKEFKTSVK